MPRYRLNEESGIVHDSRSSCDDGKHEGLTPLTFEAFKAAVLQGADPCDHCFRDDELEADSVTDNAE